MKKLAPSIASFTALVLVVGAGLGCDSDLGEADSQVFHTGGVGVGTSAGGSRESGGSGGVGAGGVGSGGVGTGSGGTGSGGAGSGGAGGVGTGSGGAGGVGAGGVGAGGVGSSAALEALGDWLENEASDRSSLEEEAFAALPLSRADASIAKALLWEDRASQIRGSRQSEIDEKSISLDGVTLNYETVLLGDEPAGGRSLFISMHGGGDAPKETNDEQWQNQIVLAESYAPEGALWIAPRAPTDDWNMWFKDHIVPLFDRLVSNMIVFEGIHPNKVYLTGYSAGGDGVYQLGPTMADRWAAAAMSAGHPNDMSPVNLRNIGFAIHVGGDDTAYDRNLVAQEWGQQLDELQLSDPEGYAHQVEVHEGLPHWMNLADQPSIPYVQGFERNSTPKKVVWRQSTLVQTRFYWLEIDPADAQKNVEVVATVEGQTIKVNSDDLSSLLLRLSDDLLDLDQVVKVEFNGELVFEGVVPRSIGALHASLVPREDPKMIYAAELLVFSE